MKRIAEGSGVVILEEPTRLSFVRYAHETAFVIAWVLALLTFFGLIALAQQIAGRSSPADALIPLGAALLTGAPLALIIRHILGRRRRADALPPLAVIDLAARQFCDGSGKPLAPLDEVFISTELQPVSSSPKLVATYGRGQKLVLVKGDPFGGGIGRLVLALRARKLLR